jgi:LysR family transcriptional regulator, regulator for genes of the gallate degradation pathway
MDRELELYPPLRSLRRAIVVGELQHLTRAADELGRSQSVMTRTILGLEKFLGVQLFERTATGIMPTREGEVLLLRFLAAIEQMRRAGEELQRVSGAQHSLAHSARHFLHLDVKNARVFVFLTICDFRSVRKSAEVLGISESAVHKIVCELERQFGLRLFERAPRNMLYPTNLGRILASYTKRALAEIRAGMDEMRSLGGAISGQVRVGGMSTARSYVIPRAVDRIRRTHPNVLVAVYWANYDDLKLALSCGDIDFIVGTLRKEEVTSTDYRTTTLMEDRIEIVARACHPMAHAKDVPLQELLEVDWILPPAHFPLRIWFRKLLKKYGLREPRPFLQTASLGIIKGTLLESDCVALMTRLQCWHEVADHGPLTVLPVDALPEPPAGQPFHLHMTKRLDSRLSPAADALQAIVIRVSAEIERSLLCREEAMVRTTVPVRSAASDSLDVLHSIGDTFSPGRSR